MHTKATELRELSNLNKIIYLHQQLFLFINVFSLVFYNNVSLRSQRSYYRFCFLQVNCTLSK